jgi:hypothetical protein
VGSGGFLSGVHEGYTREMYDRFGYLACWLPNITVALGDVGTIEGRRYARVTSLAELGVSFSTGEPSAVGDLEYTTSGAVDVALRGGVDAGAQTAAALSVTFTGTGATYFRAEHCVVTAVTGLPSLEKQLLDLDDWRADYVVVTELLRTGPAVILVSDDKGSGARAQVSAEAPPVLTAGGRLAVTARSGLAARVTVADGATPLFRAMRLRRPIVGRPRLRWRSTDPAAGGTTTALTAATWDDLPGRA